MYNVSLVWCVHKTMAMNQHISHHCLVCLRTHYMPLISNRDVDTGMWISPTMPWTVMFLSKEANWNMVRWNWNMVRWNWNMVRWNWNMVRWNWNMVRWNWNMVRWNWNMVRWNWNMVRWNTVSPWLLRYLVLYARGRGVGSGGEGRRENKWRVCGYGWC